MTIPRPPSARGTAQPLLVVTRPESALSRRRRFPAAVGSSSGQVPGTGVRPRSREPDGVDDGAQLAGALSPGALCRPKVAPNGSVTTPIRPNGVVSGDMSTLPPPSPTASTAASTSATVK